MMKRLLAVAAFLLASTAAQAQYSFEYGGRTIRIDPDRGTVSIPGVYDNSGRGPNAHIATGTAPARASNRHPSRRRPIRRRLLQTPAPAEKVPAPADTSPEPSAATAGVAPADTITSGEPPTGGRAVQQDTAPPPSPNRRPSLRPLRRRDHSPRPRGFTRPIHRSACG
jgi:hypothetical protein